MNEAQIDLAHTVALGLIDDEDHHAIQTIIDTEDPALCTEFRRELRETREALALFASATPTPPPPASHPTPTTPPTPRLPTTRWRKHTWRCCITSR